MSSLRYALSDTLVLAKRSLLRIPRAPDLLLSFTVQPIMFVLLFAYVFGGAIDTPGYSYVDFLMPGIIVQTMSFGGFVTALGLSEDLKQGPGRPLPLAADVARRRAHRPHPRRRRHQLALDRGDARRRRHRRLLLRRPARPHRRAASCCCCSSATPSPGSSPSSASPRPRRRRPSRSASSSSSRSPSSPPPSSRSTRCRPPCRPSPKSTPSRSSSTRCAHLFLGAPAGNYTSGARSPGRSASPSSSPPSRSTATNAPSSAERHGGRAGGGLDFGERGHSSAGRAPPLQGGGRRFEPGWLHNQDSDLGSRVALGRAAPTG